MAAQIYTIVDGPDCGYAEHKRRSRQEAIASARKHYQHQMMQAQAFLNTPDDELVVRVVRGWERPVLIKVLAP